MNHPYYEAEGQTTGAFFSRRFCSTSRVPKIFNPTKADTCLKELEHSTESGAIR